jgi:RNA polymerase sigma-70 factor (ECF subfamily)
VLPHERAGGVLRAGGEGGVLRPGGRGRLRVPVTQAVTNPGRAAAPAPAVAEAAWAAYRAELLAFVRRRVDDADAAEDLVHDVLARALVPGGGPRDAARLRPWLFQVMRNALVDHYRARRPHRPLPDDLAAPDGDAAGETRAELARCMAPLLRALPAGHRDAVRMSEMEGRPQREVAAALGISLSGAKSRVQRGRARLDALLHACCRIERDARGGARDFEPRAEAACGCASPGVTGHRCGSGGDGG